jgi:hypothetical protein
VLPHHPNRTLAYLRGKLAGLGHRSILSEK